MLIKIKGRTKQKPLVSTFILSHSSKKINKFFKNEMESDLIEFRIKKRNV